MKSAGTTAAIGAAGTYGSRRMLGQSSAPDPGIYNSLIAAHAIAAGNAVYAIPSANDWMTVHNAASACTNEWLANGRDAGVQNAISRISPSSITSANIDANAILANIRNYQPQFQLSDVQSFLSILDRNASMVPNVFTHLQQSGMSYYITMLMGESARLARALANGSVPAVAIRPNKQIGSNFMPEPIGEGNGTGSGYTCKDDGFNAIFVGIAFTTISVMTWGSFDVLAGAAWAGIGLWGGVGATGWGLGHAMACGF